MYPILLAFMRYALTSKAKNSSAARRTWLGTKIATVILVAVIISGNVEYINGAFTAQNVLHDRALYHVGRVLADLDSFPSRQRGDRTKSFVAIGTFDLDGEAMGSRLLNRYRWITGFGDEGKVIDTGLSYSMIFFGVARYYGYYLPYDADSYYAVARSIDTTGMPSYPSLGYIAERDDRIIIKLSEESS